MTTIHRDNGTRKKGYNMARNTAEIEAELVKETEGAYLINDGTVECWIPKSLVEKTDDGFFVMPEWLAIREDLV